ncbi:hypothetical protein FHR64_002994 [Xanthomonas arboricola]|nr:hypothetical protein [Xanthomonas arboricola]
MPLDTSLRRLTPHVVWLLVLLVALQVRDVAKALGFPIPKIPVPYGGGILDNLLSVVLVLVAAALLRPGMPGELAARLGLRWNGLRGPALTLLATLPCWLGLWTQSSSVGTDDLLGLLWLALLFPLAEESCFAVSVSSLPAVRWPGVRQSRRWCRRLCLAVCIGSGPAVEVARRC